ncbi:MAG: PLxRFG domain-containing protein [Thalassovita sp.]
MTAAQSTRASRTIWQVWEGRVEYGPVRTKVMGVISYLFHHTERANREVTFLAAYRMAKAKGANFDNKSIQQAAELTWKTHFDYQNTSRPRLMQNDATRVARLPKLSVRYVVASVPRHTPNPERRKQRSESRARRQLLGISTQMLLQAGVKGVWGYSILKALIGLFFPGGGDEAEQEVEKALLAVLPTAVVGALLNGVPGHLLESTCGRASDLLICGSAADRRLEGEDEYNYWVQQLLGAVPGMAQNIHRGVQQIGEGHVWRGTETIMPKAIRDLMRSGRYFWDGAQTYNGDDIVAGDAPWANCWPKQSVSPGPPVRAVRREHAPEECREAYP